jgi:hypothetical protein
MGTGNLGVHVALTIELAQQLPQKIRRSSRMQMFQQHKGMNL